MNGGCKAEASSVYWIKTQYPDPATVCGGVAFHRLVLGGAVPAHLLVPSGPAPLPAMPGSFDLFDRPRAQALPAPLDPWQHDPRVWRAASLRSNASPCVSSGFAALDAELPGGGWPTRMLCELLMEAPGTCEWRLLAPALRAWAAPTLPSVRAARRARRVPTALARPVLLVNPPHVPHVPGLASQGLAGLRWVWVAPEGARHSLWAVEQAIRAQAAAAVLAWLPEARPEQLRRLQVAAMASPAPVFLMRPESAASQASAAPLRVRVKAGSPWALQVQVIKRRGPPQAGWTSLPAVPEALSPLLTARMRRGGMPPSQTDAEALRDVQVSHDAPAPLARTAQSAHG